MGVKLKDWISDLVKFVVVGNFGVLTNSCVYCASGDLRLERTIIQAEKVLGEKSLNWS